MKFTENIRKEIRKLYFTWHATHPKPYCKSPPHQVWIETTNACNLRCTHCIQPIMKRRRGYMDWDLYTKIIDELAEFKPVIDLNKQGEPLLHQRTVDMIKYAKSKGLFVRLISNTTLLNKKISRELIEAGLDKMVFSMSGATKKTYEMIHVGADFKKTVKNILDFLEIKMEMGSKKPFTMTTFVEEMKTKHDLQRYKEYFSKLPLDRVYVSPLLNFFGSNPEVDVKKYRESKPRSEWLTCKTPWRMLTIDWNGNVDPCAFDYDSRHVLGNVREKTILELWNCEEMQRFRKALIEKKYEELGPKGALCLNCNQIWGPNIKVCQWPHSFANEVFASGRDILKSTFGIGEKARQKEMEKKYEHLKNHRDEWLKEMVEFNAED